jgi:hypothetical protein
MKHKKTIDDLTLQDLQDFPIWEVLKRSRASFDCPLTLFSQSRTTFVAMPWAKLPRCTVSSRSRLKSD